MSTKSGKAHADVERAWEVVSREAANFVADGRDPCAGDCIEFDEAVLTYAVALGIKEAVFARQMEHALERRLNAARRSYAQREARLVKLSARLARLARDIDQVACRTGADSEVPFAWYES